MRFQVSGFRFQVSGFRVQDSGFRVEVSGFRFQVSGFGVQGPGFMVQGSGFRVLGSGFRVAGLGFRVQGSGFRAQDSWFMIKEWELRVEGRWLGGWGGVASVCSSATGVRVVVSACRVEGWAFWRCQVPSIKCCHVLEGTRHSAVSEFNIQLLGEYGTCKSVKAKFWPNLSGKNP